jgi:hypothetical protein
MNQKREARGIITTNPEPNLATASYLRACEVTEEKYTILVEAQRQYDRAVSTRRTAYHHMREEQHRTEKVTK